MVLISVISINDVFAEHTKVTIIPTPGSGEPGCEETVEGCFIPKEAIVDVGGKVIFSNTDTVAHTFTAGKVSEGHSETSEGHSVAFDSSLVNTGNSYEWIPTIEGVFPYHCMVHPWMEGTIFVEAIMSNSNGTASPTDTDGDAILDSSDSCPTDPETVNGFQDTDGCPDVVPPTDTDGDGISDSNDQCPTQAETVNGSDDSDGCPDVIPPTDTDGDEISDSLDSCPIQAETVNKFQDTDGCPDKIESDKNDLVLTYAAIGIGVAGAGTAIGIKLHSKGSGGKDAKNTNSDKHDDDQGMSAHVEVRITGGIE